MKKAVTAVLVALMLLTACSNSKASQSIGAASSSTAQSTAQSEASLAAQSEEPIAVQSEVSLAVQSEAPAKGLTIVPSQEPPLPKYIASASVPDFLTEEQQNLYKRANALSYAICGPATNIDYFYEDSGPPQTFGKEYKDERYSFSVVEASGRYKRWDDFEAVMLDIFTPELFAKITSPTNNPNGALPYAPSFFEQDGKLIHATGEMGSNIELSDIDPSFELVNKTDDVIEFKAIYYFVDMSKHENGWTDLPRDEYDYTVAFPIGLKNTANGWRVSVISNAGFGGVSNGEEPEYRNK